MADYITRTEATQLFYVREAVDAKTADRNIQVAFKRGDSAPNDTYKGRPGELTYDKEKHNIRMHDGEVMGGHVFVNVTDLYTRPELDSIVVDINTTIQTTSDTLTALIDTTKSELQGEISTTSGTLTTLINTTKSELEGNLNTLSTEFNNLVDTTISEINSQINDVTTSVTELIDTTISEINVSIQTIETSIAPENNVVSVAGRKGDVTLTRSDVGLSEVDNTRDSEKPVSTPQQSALNGKMDKVDILDFGEL